MDKKIFVFGVEEETLINSDFHIRKEVINSIAMVLSNIRNSGKDVILVTAGAIASGIEKLNKTEYPSTLEEKQAYAAIGQVEMIKRYQNIFDEYTQMVAQVLLSRDMIHDSKQKTNATNTFSTLLSQEIIPIINENDTISTADIEEENNYLLNQTVSNVMNANASIKIEPNLSFKVLCKGNDKFYTLKDKDKLFEFIDTYDFDYQDSVTANYPINFPKESF